MKLSVFTAATPDMEPEQLAAAAAAAGLDGIEWRYKETPEELRQEPPSYWRNNLCTIPPSEAPERMLRFRQAAEKHKLAIVSVTPYLTVGDLEGTEKALQAAKLLGASFIRLAVPGYHRTENARVLFDRELAYLREVEPLCRQYGVKGLLETHHMTIAASASAAYRLCEGFDPDWIGVLYDPGNMVHEGFENYRMGLEILGPYLTHVHVKNAGWRPEAANDGSIAWKAEWQSLKQGMVPWRQVIDDLKAVGYTGYLGVEDFSGVYGTEEMLRQFASYMKELLYVE
ncbi:sugar phosphate isomerase/epimerase family protein [Paenibacillus turpanensis]|uniref:sugar phosphate isomerase/epimerase family protein n=1 Tax=Paenibacillus turpanensis TaxID=2689078 RepID=UPI00140B0AAC|nr:sugar phosphate isomerase/epimerase family protein [Paenibacillus turpanensis]